MLYVFLLYYNVKYLQLCAKYVYKIMNVVLIQFIELLNPYLLK